MGMMGWLTRIAGLSVSMLLAGAAMAERVPELPLAAGNGAA